MKAQSVQSSAVVDRPERQRYELAVEGHVVFADYQRQSDRILITHVETPTVLRGRGLASVLMQGLVGDAEGRGLQIVPVCSYAQDWMRQRRT